MSGRTSVVACLAVALALAACVEVPDTVKGAFAPATPTDRSNYRIGPHGTAPPADVGTASFGAPPPDAGAVDADAGAPAIPDAPAPDASAPEDDAAAAPPVEGATS